MNFSKFNLPFLVIAIFFTSECFAQFGHSSSFSQDRAHRRFIESYRKKKENGDNVDAYYRSQGSIGYGPVNGIYKLQYSYRNPESTGITDAYFSGELEAKVTGSAFSFGGERYFPLGKIDDKSTIALTLGADITMIKFKFQEMRLNGGYEFTPEYQLWQNNFPLGLAYKTGTDVALRKNVKSGFSIGGGAMVSSTVVFAGSQDNFLTFSLRPYAMMEMAFYTGICWKIRGTGTFGKGDLVRGGEYLGSQNSADGDNSMSLTAKSSFMVSLILMDFSWDWDEE